MQESPVKAIIREAREAGKTTYDPDRAISARNVDGLMPAASPVVSKKPPIAILSGTFPSKDFQPVASSAIKDNPLSARVAPRKSLGGDAR